jgi:peptidoglycan/LPS O-acetylase OafA/YrhL
MIVNSVSLEAEPDVAGMVPAERPAGSLEPKGRARLPFLDGIRAIAVAAVLLYHGGITGINGGLLGVDVFFVLSGFLITCLLCTEYLAAGRIRLARFWAGRARRLLPALFLLLAGVALYAWVFRSTLDVSSIRGDVLSTLLYFANWHFVVSGQGYFAQSTAPSPLLHMWSLSVEEQYYLVWPLIALFVLHRRGPRGVAWVAAIGALASSLLMGAMYLHHVSIDRLYYGTDTRAQALLVGSALGAVAAKREWRVIATEWARTSLGRVVGPCLAVLSTALLLWAFHAGTGQSALLYKGGFLVVAVAAGAMITAVTSWRTSVLCSILSLRPFIYIGRISYGLYLYHWPLFLALDHARTGLSGISLLAIRLVATFAIAVVSFHVVEEPIRKGHLARTWRGLLVAGGGAVATAALLVVATAPAGFAGVPSSGSLKTGLTSSQRHALVAAGAFGPHPVRLLWLGDSVAFTAAVGLTVQSVPRYGIQLNQDALLGCDLDLAPSRLGGVVYKGVPGFNCGSWQSLWSKEVAKVRPEVVGLLIGRFDIADHFYKGHWMHVGQPIWDARLEADLEQAITILTAGGAHVALLTFPDIDPPLEQANGAIYPENDPARVVAWNRLLTEIAKKHRSTVTLMDLNRMLDPNGHFTETVDGIAVRWPGDGIHVSKAGGLWLQPQLLPEIGQLGLQVRSRGQ